MFSRSIPTFNNLDYLKLCLKSLKKNSSYEHDIIIFINEGNDGTLTYVKDNNLKFLHSDINKGVCFAYNESTKIAKNNPIFLSVRQLHQTPTSSPCSTLPQPSLIRPPRHIHIHIHESYSYSHSYSYPCRHA